MNKGITLIELLELFSLPCGQKLHLQDYEEELLLERAKEYKMEGEELEKLKIGIKKGVFFLGKGERNIYDLSTGEVYNITELSKKEKVNLSTAKKYVLNKICINGKAYSYNKNDLPYFFKIFPTKKLYFCKELNMQKTSKEWKDFFKDEKFKPSTYVFGNWKYKGKYSFSLVEIKYLFELIDLINKNREE